MGIAVFLSVYVVVTVAAGSTVGPRPVEGTPPVADSHGVENTEGFDVDKFFNWLNEQGNDKTIPTTHTVSEVTQSVTESPGAESTTGFDKDKFFHWLNEQGKHHTGSEDMPSVTDNPKSDNTTGFDMNKFFNWLNEHEQNKTIFTNHTGSERPLAMDEDVTSTQRPGATTEVQDSFAAWLDRMEPATSDQAQSGTESTNVLSTSQNTGALANSRDISEAPAEITQERTKERVDEAMASTTADPNIDEDIEWLRNMFPETGSSQEQVTETNQEQKTGTTTSQNIRPEMQGNRRKHKNSDLPPPDKFYEWLNSLRKTSKSESLQTDQSQTVSKMVPPGHNSFMTTNLIIVLSILAGILGLFAIVISAYVIYRRKTPQKTVDKCDIPTKPESEVYFSGTDVFHGIPVNKDIWKNLDTLSKNAPSVLPDSQKY